MAKALTSKFVAAAKSSEARVEFPDAASPGLYLVVQPSGVKSWALRYRLAGKPKKLTIGPALVERAVPLPEGRRPDLGDGHTLAEARVAAGTILEALKEGRDPATEKKRALASSASGADTASAALDDFLEKHVDKKNRPSTARETRRFIVLYLRPAWGDKKIKRIAKADVNDVLHDVEERGGPASANRVLAIISKFFNWTVERGLLSSSPAKGVKAPAAIVSRDRVLTDDEIRWFWKATEGFGYPFGSVWQMLLLTGQRREEVAGAVRKEFLLSGDKPSWLIPRERSKNGNEHLVPLSADAVAILERLPKVSGGFLFTTTGTTSVSGYSKAKKRLDAAMLEIAGKEADARGADPAQVEIPEWRLHDLRRTAASGMAALGFAVHVVEAVLNHKSGKISGVAAVYNRHEYADEKRAALTAWSNKVRALIEPAASNVVPLRA
ncbi:site-specific integrase [Mesorhizobium sp.]|uniref:tyrosine-type recombinase/integrase n=1 Tax=Mesorhizobium sp. TaxID=1871066 RepID=UPI000FE7469E|nr:site-specific integrase [Mesorhizobium sp.]RWO21739.1 MAG: site-specific integrase [Mesorhizobium sp.]